MLEVRAGFCFELVGSSEPATTLASRLLVSMLCVAKIGGRWAISAVSGVLSARFRLKPPEEPP